MFEYLGESRIRISIRVFCLPKIHLDKEEYIFVRREKIWRNKIILSNRLGRWKKYLLLLSKNCLESCEYPTLARSHRWRAAYVPGSVASKWIHTYWRSIIDCARVRRTDTCDSMAGRHALSGHPSNRLAAHNPHTCSSDGHILHPQSTRCGSAGYTIQDIETKHGDGSKGASFPFMCIDNRWQSYWPARPSATRFIKDFIKQWLQSGIYFASGIGTLIHRCGPTRPDGIVYFFSFLSSLFFFCWL